MQGNLQESQINVSHLKDYATFVHGPIQKDEALFLYSLCKMTRPRTIVEFGLLAGHSSFNFLSAADPECMLFGFDIRDRAVETTRKRCAAFRNGVFSVKDCTDFQPSDIQNRKIDLCFLDCSHKLELNKLCLAKVLPQMAEDGILAIHDTGSYHQESVQRLPEHHKSAHPLFHENFKRIKSCPVIITEKQTVDWMRQEHADWAQINFHCRNYFRHGITLLQRSTFLVPESKRNQITF